MTITLPADGCNCLHFTVGPQKICVELEILHPSIYDSWQEYVMFFLKLEKIIF